MFAVHSAGGADLFAYGPDARALYAAIEEDIRAYDPPAGSYALLVFGSDADSPQRTIDLPSPGTSVLRRSR